MRGDAVSKISELNLKILALRSGNRCAFPGCPVGLVAGNDAVLGEAAHIKGQNPGSARHDSTLTDDQRNHHGNLIFLCPNHHTEIDKINPLLYPAEKLLEMKLNHERWVSEQCRKQVSEVRFAELKVVTDYLIAASVTHPVSFQLIPLQDKIRRNSLSSLTEADIMLGLSRVTLVEDYIRRNPDAEFGNRLRQGFVDKYLELKDGSGLNGDELFLALQQFSSGNKPEDFRLQAAGLTVLVYLFQACDVFEK